ncbi:phage recombination protein Bet [bacterium]|nr:phage recombination protein Bet [bacterium]
MSTNNNSDKSGALVVPEKTEKPSVELSIDLIRRYICENATDQEAFAFLQLCRSQNLNPFLKEAYLIKYDRKAPATMVVGKDTFTKRADRLAEFDGAKAGIIVTKDNAIVYREGSVVMPGETLIGGWAEVFRKDRSHSFRNECSMAEYDRKTRSWREMPGTMVRKVALVQSLREAFPSSFSGMYTAEEMQLEPMNLPEYTMVDPMKVPHEVIEVQSAGEPAPAPAPVEEQTQADSDAPASGSVTPKQIGLINKLLLEKCGIAEKPARRAYLSREFGYDGKNMSKQQASDVIKQLLSMPEKGGEHNEH